MNYFYLNLVSLFLILLMVLMSITFMILFERKFLIYGYNNQKLNKVGFLYLFQSFNDIISLLNKKSFIVNKVNYYYYNFSFILILFLSMMMWLLYFFEGSGIVINVSIMYLFTLMSLDVFSMILNKLSLDSNYSMMSCFRLIYQSVSFEVMLTLIILISIMMIENYSFMFFSKYSISYILFMLPIYIMFLFSLLINLNRTSINLTKSISGFNVDYFSGCFTFIFMAEYLSIIFMSFLVSIMFFNYDIGSLKFLMFWIFHIFFVIWIYNIFMNNQYYKLINLYWKKIMLIVLCYFLMIVTVKSLVLCNIFYCDYPYWLAIISGIMN